MTSIITQRSAQAECIVTEWGDLTWWARRSLGNSATMTVGRCCIKPGCGNPPHRHPNCSEVLVVVSGRIAHTGAGGVEVELGPGDCVCIPPGIPHRARNIGADVAELHISFDSADRQVEGE